MSDSAKWRALGRSNCCRNSYEPLPRGRALTVTESITGRLLLDRLRTAGVATHDWWPVDIHTPLRRLIAGVLVQRTTATNAYLALRNLDRAGLLVSPEVLLSAPLEHVTKLVLPAGFYTTKPRSVQGIVQWWSDHETDHIQMSDAQLRQSLDAVYGVGPETADLALISALDRGSFVADEYARRLFQGIGLFAPKGYEQFHAYAMTLCADFTPDEFHDFHALKVQYGKEVTKGLRTYAALLK